ncbi:MULTISPECIES: hypothetical protein [unclassified Streptomyces]|uniref:hypothetical protein n=1 Tax=unclassified Streptomyces TaxID=2593676 RepID=UPI0033B36235
MSLSLAERCVSNPRRQLAAITVIVVIMLFSPSWAEVVGAYADAGTLVGLFIAVSAAAAKYRNRNNQPQAVRPGSA